MAVMRLGLQRALRKMRQDLSRATLRSTGARAADRARLIVCGVDRCVFVVAADQQVLEQALTEASSQATPADTGNPYYSSGSGYLDKVFQYQVSVPPLMSLRVSHLPTSPALDESRHSSIHSFSATGSCRSAGRPACSTATCRKGLMRQPALPVYAWSSLSSPATSFLITRCPTAYALCLTTRTPTWGHTSPRPSGRSRRSTPGRKHKSTGCSPTPLRSAAPGRRLVPVSGHRRGERDGNGSARSGAGRTWSAAPGLPPASPLRPRSGPRPALPAKHGQRVRPSLRTGRNDRPEFGVAAANVATSALFLYADAGADASVGADAAVETLALCWPEPPACSAPRSSPAPGARSPAKDRRPGSYALPSFSTTISVPQPRRHHGGSAMSTPPSKPTPCGSATWSALTCSRLTPRCRPTY